VRYAFERVDVSRLVPFARNSRTHSAEQIGQLVRSIQEFGFTAPVLIDEGGGIVAGHGRVMAARELRLEEVPCIRLVGLSDAQRRAYVIADNKLALNAGWDESMLAGEVASLADAGFDLGLLGFSAPELAAITNPGSAGLTDPDEAPPAPEVPVTRLGDAWLLGAHRIVCGDSTDAAVVAAALAGVKPQLMVTDPPYGVEYDPLHARATGTAAGKVLNDTRSDWREAWALFPGAVAYVWHAALRAKEVVEGLEASGFSCRAQIIWDKTRPIMSRGHYHFQHEPCWYAVRKGAPANWAGDRKQSTVWAIKHRKSETGHGTQKPVECMKRPIKNNSSPGQAVYEPFSGSGTTIIAAEMTGRSCHAIELSPAYVDVAVKRWQSFTGKQATHADTGEPFPI
jgi:DNA modification methylase